MHILNKDWKVCGRSHVASTQSVWATGARGPPICSVFEHMADIDGKKRCRIWGWGAKLRHFFKNGSSHSPKPIQKEKEGLTGEGCVGVVIPWQLCQTIGPLLSQRFPLASAKAQPRGDFWNQNVFLFCNVQTRQLLSLWYDVYYDVILTVGQTRSNKNTTMLKINLR